MSPEERVAGKSVSSSVSLNCKQSDTPNFTQLRLIKLGTVSQRKIVIHIRAENSTTISSERESRKKDQEIRSVGSTMSGEWSGRKQTSQVTHLQESNNNKGENQSVFSASSGTSSPFNSSQHQDSPSSSSSPFSFSSQSSSGKSDQQKGCLV